MLLLTLIGTPKVPVLCIQGSKVRRTDMMRLYMMADQVASPTKAKTIRGKLSSMLRRKGVPSAAKVHLSWEPGGSVELKEARTVVESAIRGAAFTENSAEFWASRVVWHEGKVRTAAQGMSGKNMRQSALLFDMKVQRSCSEEEQRQVRAMLDKFQELLS